MRPFGEREALGGGVQFCFWWGTINCWWVPCGWCVRWCTCCCILVVVPPNCCGACCAVRWCECGAVCEDWCVHLPAVAKIKTSGDSLARQRFSVGLRASYPFCVLHMMCAVLVVHLVAYVVPKGDQVDVSSRPKSGFGGAGCEVFLYCHMRRCDVVGHYSLSVSRDKSDGS